jgi:hypothetical protein
VKADMTTNSPGCHTNAGVPVADSLGSDNGGVTAGETALLRLTVQSVGPTKEEAIRHALKVIGGILAQAGTDYSCGSTTGGARAEWEEL